MLVRQLGRVTTSISAASASHSSIFTSMVLLSEGLWEKDAANDRLQPTAVMLELVAEFVTGFCQDSRVFPKTENLDENSMFGKDVSECA